MSSQSEIETGLFYFFPFLVRKGSWLSHLTLVMDHGELRMSFHVSMKQQYLYSWSLFYHTILPHSMTSFLFDFIPLKPQANACNIVGQQLPTLLDFTVCICLHTLLQVVVCCWTKFETGQTFIKANNSSTFLFVLWSLKHSATMLDPFAQPFQHCWGHARALHMVSKVLWAISFPWCTAAPNIVGSCCIHLHYVGSCCVCLHLAEHTTLSNTFLAFCPEHSKTSKWVLKLQFLTVRQDHKDPFTFMSETHLNPPSPPTQDF